jgi:hypothetical protein
MLFFDGLLDPSAASDVTLSTYDVARTIRCEARKSVREKVKVFLQYTILENGQPDLPAREIGARLEANSTLFYKIDSKWFTGLTKFYLDTFKNSAVAYDFTFDMTEVNNVDAAMSPAAAWLIARGLETLPTRMRTVALFPRHHNPCGDGQLSLL